jgi:DNA-binding NarL/FixJ family response regulator
MMVILASKLDDRQISKAMGNKIAGFLLKDSDVEKMPCILKDILFGKYYMNPQVSSRLFHIFAEVSERNKQTDSVPKWIQSIPEELSRTELQIMSYIGEGRSNKEIAECLSLTVGTVRNYISSILHKASVRDRTQIAIYALRNGLVNNDNF